MKIKMRYGAAVFMAVFWILFSGCKKSPEQKVLGKWNSVVNGISYSMILEKNGAASMNVGDITFIAKYMIDDESITIEVDTDAVTHLYILSPDGKTLTIKNFLGSGIDVTLIKE
jgi:hypothetical protein